MFREPTVKESKRYFARKTAKRQIRWMLADQRVEHQPSEDILTEAEYKLLDFLEREQFDKVLSDWYLRVVIEPEIRREKMQA